MINRIFIFLIAIAFAGCGIGEKEVDVIESTYLINLDSIISENDDTCKAYLYNCLKLALESDIENSRKELRLFESCLDNIEDKGSYSQCAYHLRLIIKEENSEYLKGAVEVLIPYLDSLQYDSLSLFQPSKPYTVTVADSLELDSMGLLQSHQSSDTWVVK